MTLKNCFALSLCQVRQKMYHVPDKLELIAAWFGVGIFFFPPFVSHLGRILTQVGKYLETHAGDKALYLIKDFVGGIN